MFTEQNFEIEPTKYSTHSLNKNDSKDKLNQFIHSIALINALSNSKEWNVAIYLPKNFQ